MREFFRNTRKHKCAELPEIIARKSKFARKRKSGSTADLAKIDNINIWGVKNYLPPDTVGEDERTLELYRRTVVKQYSAHPYNRKDSVWQVALEKTFAWRRRMVVNDQCSVAELLDKFPLLKEPRQVFHI